MTLTTFDFNESPVRACVDEAGEPWFVAADVCRVLELQNPTKAIAALDDDETMTLTNTEGHSGQRGGAQSFNLISEAGLYSLIFRSRKPQAKVFKRWVTHEVLPAIRRCGRFEMAAIDGPWIDRDDSIIRQVVRAIEQLASGALPLARAQAIFTGAKVYHGLRLLSRDSLPELPIPAEVDEHPARLLKAAADRLEADGHYNMAALQALALELRLCGRVDAEGGLKSLGRQCQPWCDRLLRDSRGRVFTVRHQRTAVGTRYAIEFETAAAAAA